MKVRLIKKSERIVQLTHSSGRAKMKEEKQSLMAGTCCNHHPLCSPRLSLSPRQTQTQRLNTLVVLAELEAASAKRRGTSCSPDSPRARQPQKNRSAQFQGPGHSPEFLQQDFEKEASRQCCIIYTQFTAPTLPGPTLRGNLLFSACGM